MSRVKSTRFRQAAQAVSAAELPLVLLEISHALLAEPASFRTDSYVPTDLSLTRNITITATPAKLAVRGQR